MLFWLDKNIIFLFYSKILVRNIKKLRKYKKVILFIIFIKRYEGIGVAIATVSIFIFSSILGRYFMFKELKVK